MSDTHQEILDDALERYREAVEYDRDQRKEAVMDLRFVTVDGGQWESDVAEARRNAKRPLYTVDRVTPALNQIIGDQRQNRVSIDVLPDTERDKKTAEVYTGLMRSIQKQSNAESVYDAAFFEALAGGYGGWRVLTGYAGDSFEQEITLEPIHSAASSLFFDPASRRPDASDARYAFLVTDVAEEDFERMFPDAEERGFEAQTFGPEWGKTEGVVRVAEYWYKKPKTRRIGLLSSGRVIDLDEEAAVLDELALLGDTVVKQREVGDHEVYMVRMDGSGPLEGPQLWPGREIPLVPVYGHLAYIEGKRYVRGLVRKAKDPQRILNYATSTIVESAALAPKDPFLATPAQLMGHEARWARMNVANEPVLPYNPDSQAPGPPQRAGAPTVQQALLAQVAQAVQDIHATTGLEPASLGNVPELKSGKAIQAQQAMGDRGSYIYLDNLQHAIARTGRILLDLIPRIYDTERVVRVLKLDGNGEDVVINQTVVDRQTGQQVKVNDLSQGRYSVTVSTGPAFATQRKESAEQIVKLAQAQPEIMGLAMDIVIENLGMVDGQELKQRVRNQMIKAGTLKPTPEEAQELGLDRPPQPDPMNQAAIENFQAQTEQLRVQTEKIIADIRAKEADTNLKIIEAQKASVESFDKLMDALKKELDARLPVTPVDVEALHAQKTVVLKTSEESLTNGQAMQ